MARDRPALHHLGRSGCLKCAAPNLQTSGCVIVTITPASCEIRDFKTGLPKEEHEFQLRTYALLWWRDRNVNPSGRVADRLVISYDASDVKVPAPDPEALGAIEDELRRRTSAAVAALEEDPPEARPSMANCASCGVRQLCDAYWRCFSLLVHEAPEAWFGDLQLKLVARHGTKSWDGIVESCSGLKAGQPVLLRTVGLPFDLRAGQRLRVLNVHISAPDEDPGDDEPAPAIGTMGSASEAFLLPV